MAESPQTPRTPDTPRGQPRTPRLVKAVLFVSVALNLVIVGLIAGLWIDKGPPRRDGGPAGIAFLQALAPEDRRRLVLEFGQTRERGRGVVTPEATRALEVLRRTPFDSAAFAAALEAETARNAARRAAGQAALVARVAAMSEAERRAYADRLEVRLAGQKRR
ncbi:Heavy-metal resistance [Roseivivax lentus]|uniref:Heavy-metal resistance n=1 Tax=Roseivivax lentus TaxID=633194 RepID=A0A1N7PP74_9RHOB|nr:periplasmic heavy metal sensor [Roseivivax lentus]SIT12310.1 Heavy-metal resistance [Roseivivax lentus]